MGQSIPFFLEEESEIKLPRMTNAPMEPVYLRAMSRIFLTKITVVLTVVRRDGDYLVCVNSS